MYRRLSEAFKAVAAKYLVLVDTPRGSNQHEIGGLKRAGVGDEINAAYGTGKSVSIPATYVRVDDGEDPVVIKGSASWYDARLKKKGKRGAEYRLYYEDNSVTRAFDVEDFLLVALGQNDELLIVSTPARSEAERRVRAIFDIENLIVSQSFIDTHIKRKETILPLEYVFADAFGIELEDVKEDASLMTALVQNFGKKFPTTAVFSEYARLTLPGIDPLNHPDEALLEWYRQETRLFKLMEKLVIRDNGELQELIKKAVDTGDLDVEPLISIAKSILNTRKSRAGLSFQNHIGYILKVHKIKYVAQAHTEGNETPDFLFPDSESYANPLYDRKLLRMLAAKTSLKDRWRQVLKEADKIEFKHLITMDTMMTEPQVNEIQDSRICLIVPSPLQTVYKNVSFATFADFLDEVKGLGHVIELG